MIITAKVRPHQNGHKEKIKKKKGERMRDKTQKTYGKTCNTQKQEETSAAAIKRTLYASWNIPYIAPN